MTAPERTLAHRFLASLEMTKRTTRHLEHSERSLPFIQNLKSIKDPHMTQQKVTLITGQDRICKKSL